MTKTAFKKLVGNTFFTVKFLKKSGEVRVLNGRLSVKRHLKHPEAATSVRTPSSNKKLITCWDRVKKEYRSFDLDRVLLIKARGLFLTKGN